MGGAVALPLGTAGLGRLLAEGDPAAVAALERLAGDDRWLVRENLKKSRLTRADPDRLARLRALAGLGPGV